MCLAVGVRGRRVISNPVTYHVQHVCNNTSTKYIQYCMCNVMVFVCMFKVLVDFHYNGIHFHLECQNCYCLVLCYKDNNDDNYHFMV